MVKVKTSYRPPSVNESLEILREDGSISQDIKEILEKWYKDISQLYSGVRENPDLVYDQQFYEDILRKKAEFENLDHLGQASFSHFNAGDLNIEISEADIQKGVNSLKNRKAYLLIPNEALKNKNAIKLLHVLFNLCFTSGLSPTEWNFSSIKPIPKKDKDCRVPLNNRCITLMSSISKL